MKIPFTKAHGARNDFLLTPWSPQDLASNDPARIAQGICNRYTGIGADGWLLISKQEGVDARIDLWNSDGSTSPISGNGTRCAAAFVVDQWGGGTDLKIATGAGIKHLKLLERKGLEFLFEMNMGAARVDELHATGHGRDAVILDVGNPQCAVFVDDFNFAWETLGAAIESDPRFPLRTNVSFIKVVDRHTLDVRFYERGAGVTMSSGTGSTGAAAAANARGLIDLQVRVDTPAGPLQLRWAEQNILLAGPAEIIGSGEYYSA